MSPQLAPCEAELTLSHTADALQKLCQQRTPVPPWVAMHRIRIPQATSGRAAEVLIDALGGEEMAFKVAGGTKWWQVRAGDGVECEWITMKKDYREKKDRSASPMTQSYSQKKRDTSATHMAPSSSQEGSGEANPDDDDCGCELLGLLHELTAVVPEMDRLRCMLFGKLKSSCKAHAQSMEEDTTAARSTRTTTLSGGSPRRSEAASLPSTTGVGPPLAALH